MKLSDIKKSLSCLERIGENIFECKNSGVKYTVHGNEIFGCCPLTGIELEATDFISNTTLVKHVEKLFPYVAVFNFDAVIAVGRSGFLPGTLLATQMHIPLFSLNIKSQQLIDPGNGNRIECHFELDELTKKRCLVIDDSVAGGRTAQQVHSVLQKFGLPRDNYVYLAVYGSEFAFFNIDFFGIRYPLPHFFEWNYLNSHYLPFCGCTFEGIFIDHDIHVLKQNRCQKLRFLFLEDPSNEALARTMMKAGWLQNTEIVCRNGDLLTSKISAIQSHHAEYYIEPDPEQAKAIAKETGIWVICPQAEKVFTILTAA